MGGNSSPRDARTGKGMLNFNAILNMASDFKYEIFSSTRTIDEISSGERFERCNRALPAGDWSAANR